MNVYALLDLSIVVLASLFLVDVLAFGYGTNSYKWAYFKYFALFPVCMAFTAIISNVLFTEVMPKQISGGLNGVRVLVNYILVAITISLTGFMFDRNKEWIWYTPCLWLALYMILTVVIMVGEEFRDFDILTDEEKAAQTNKPIHTTATLDTSVDTSGTTTVTTAHEKV